MIIIRSAIFNFVFYAAFIFLMVVGSPCLLLGRAATLGLVRLWARLSVALLRIICGTKLEFRNLHLLPKGPALIAAKHQSFFETFALITVLDDFSFILKKELAALPLFGWYVRASEQIGIDRARRGAVLSQLYREVGHKLSQRRQIVIFPEGTRRTVGAPPAYKPGIAALCARFQLPCTPVALNSGLFWPRRGFLRWPGTVVIEILPAIAPDMPRDEFLPKLQHAIETATSALVAGALAADPGLQRAAMKDRPAAA
jgi:1-acyl-sn-glycerol-3-phosphate acyltransferase